MTHRTTAAILCGLLALTGCTTTRVGLDPQWTLEVRMRMVADRFGRDRSVGGLTEVIADIQRCYRETTVPAILPWALRNCIVLDNVGYQEDVRIGQRVFHETLPFWVDDAFDRRTWHYAQIDGFKTQEQLVKYFVDSGDLVHFYLKQMPWAPYRPTPEHPY